MEDGIRIKIIFKKNNYLGFSKICNFILVLRDNQDVGKNLRLKILSQLSDKKLGEMLPQANIIAS